MLREEIGINIKERRIELGFTQTKLSELARITRGTMYRLEKGEAQLTFKTLNKILDVLDMEIVVRDKK